MHRRASGTSLFLMEMLVVILFFSLAAAVCMRVFAAAKLASTYSKDLSVAAVRVESAAECFKAADGDVAEAAKNAGAETANGGFFICYDAEWQTCGEADAKYTLVLNAEGNEAHIAVSDREGTELFGVDAVALIGEGGAA